MKHNTKLELVIFDLAGTVIEFGSLATIKAIKKIFIKKNIHISNELIKKYMGLKKINHIKKILESPQTKTDWKKQFKKNYSHKDLKNLNIELEKKLILEVKKNFNIIPFVKKILQILKKNKVKIAFTTGYPKKIVRLIIKLAKLKNLSLKNIICVDDVKKGRPHPDMCNKIINKFNIKNRKNCIKIDDSVAGIIEGKKAKMCTIGLVFTGIQTGLSKYQLKKIKIKERLKIQRDAYKNFKNAGANFVLNDVFEMKKVLSKFNIY